ncbi:gliding motility protein [Streptomyces sp. NPDC005151]
MGVFSWFRRSSSEAVETSAEVAASASSEATVDTSVTSTGSESSEGVEIPKQQSADEAADNEAGDNART